MLKNKNTYAKYSGYAVLLALLFTLAIFLAIYKEELKDQEIFGYYESCEISAPVIDGEGFYIISELVCASDEVYLYAEPDIDSLIAGKMQHGAVLLRTGHSSEWDRLIIETGETVYAKTVYLDKLAETSLNIKNIPVYYGNLDGKKSNNFVLNGGLGFKIEEELFDNLQNHLESVDYSVGFYLFDIGSGMSVSQNAEKSFFAASTIKAANALYIYTIADSGTARLTDTMEYLPYHASIDTSVLRYEDFGSNHTIKSLLEKSIIYSDNSAYYMLLEKYGIDGFNDFMKSLGCEIAGNLSDSYRWGEITPRETVMVWKEIYNYIHNGKYGNLFLEQLVVSQNRIITEALPQYTIAHKYGLSNNYYNDVAIIYGKRPYILAIFTEIEGKGANREFIGKLAQLLDEVIIEYTEYLK